MPFDVRPSNLDDANNTLSELDSSSQKNRTRVEVLRKCYTLIERSSQITTRGPIFALQMPMNNEPNLKVKVNPLLRTYFGGGNIGDFRTQISSSLNLNSSEIRELLMFVDYGFGSRTRGTRVQQIYYGCLDQYVGANHLNYSAFRNICNEFASGRLPGQIAQDSDVEGVSIINQAIFNAINQVRSYGSCRTGINIRIGRTTYPHVIGCLPVTSRNPGGAEPKADMCLVSLDDTDLIPSCFISYKMGTNVSGFQQYGGVSSDSGNDIFQHVEVVSFFSDLQTYVQNQTPLMIENNVFSPSGSDFWREINDNDLSKMSMFGVDVNSSQHGINRCHIVAQGIARISGNARTRDYTMNFSHLILDSDSINALSEYKPVLGATRRTGRNTSGPNNIRLEGLRVGIYPKGFRSRWVSQSSAWYSGGSQFLTS